MTCSRTACRVSQLQRVKPSGMQANPTFVPRSSRMVFVVRTSSVVVLLMVLVMVNHSLAWRSDKELVGCGMDGSRKGSW